MSSHRDHYLFVAQAALASHFAAVARLRGYKHNATDVVGFSFQILCMADTVVDEPTLYRALEKLIEQLHERYTAVLNAEPPAKPKTAATVPTVKDTTRRRDRAPWLSLPRGWLQ